MKVTFPLTVIAPGFVSPFNARDAQGNLIPSPGTAVTYSAEVDSADIASLFPVTAGGTAPAHQTAAELRKEYSDVELIAALQSPKI